MNSATKITTNSIILGIIIGVVSTLSVSFVLKKTKRPKPKWQKVGKVKKLVIYPLKGGHGIEIENAICTEFGLQAMQQNNRFQLRDKNFVVYDENTKEIVTAQTYPLLTDIWLTAYDENNVILDAVNRFKLKIRIPNQVMIQQPLMIIYQGEEIPTIDCHSGSVWISSYILDKRNGLRLAHFDSAQKRNICNQEFTLFCEKLQYDVMGKYLDLTSYLMLNQSSINKLSSQIQNGEISSKNFRANILIEDDNEFVYDEDNWKLVKIGHAVFSRNDFENETPSKITRGKIKNVEEVSMDEGNSPVGAAMKLKKWGSISVGDDVFVKRY